MGWVNVNEHLPPDYKPCIILLDGHDEAEDAMAVVTEEGWYWWVDGIGDTVEGHVTHWMERPKAPKATVQKSPKEIYSNGKYSMIAIVE